MKRLYDQCIRCGERAPWGRAVCASCNPGDLPSPSPSQYHATVFLTVVGAMLVMALVLLVRG